MVEKSWAHGFHEAGHLSMTSTGQVIVRGTKWCSGETKRMVQVWCLDGHLQSEWPSKCKHHVQMTSWVTSCVTYLAEACWVCGAIYIYDITAGQDMPPRDVSLFSVDGIWPKSICVIEEDGQIMFYVWDRHNSNIMVMKWEETLGQLYHKSSVPFVCHNATAVSSISNVGQKPYLVLTHGRESLISCVHIPSGEIIWTLGGHKEIVAGMVLDPREVCCGPSDYVFVADKKNERILQIDGVSGQIAGILEDMVDICHIAWNSKDEELIVCHSEEIVRISVSFLPDLKVIRSGDHNTLPLP